MFAAILSCRLVLSLVLLLPLSPVLLALLRPIQSQCDAASPVLRLDLKGRSFQLDLRATVQSLSPGTPSAAVYEITEFHSNPQQRSKIRYTVFGGRRENEDGIDYSMTLYAGKQDCHMVSERHSSCVLVEKNSFDQMMNINILANFDSGHLMGAARLLLFIEEKLELFTIAPDASDGPSDLLMYSASFAADQREGRKKFDVQLFYHVEAVKNLAHGIPRHVVIKNSNTRVNYNIRRFRQLRHDRPQVSPVGTVSGADVLNQASLGASVDMIAFDMFALTRAIGCSQFAAPTTNDFLSALERTDGFRFSFRARPLPERGLAQLEMAVAYEPHLGVLRVDQQQGVRAFTSLTDYTHSRKFHIVRRLAPDSSNTDPVLERVLDAGDDTSCVVTRAKTKDEPLSNLWNPFLLGQMLLGTERLFYLGLAYVRGVEARAFEWTDCEWPVWLEQPVIYQVRSDGDNKNKSASRPELKIRRGTEGYEERGLFLTNVFYFSNSNDDTDENFKLTNSKLLLLEVITRVKRTGRLVNRKVIHIYDFAWSLPSSSPVDGERYEDLFSLKDACLADMDDGDEYATISVSLKTETNAEDSNLGWLHQRPKRNLALINMAQNELSLTSTMLYDLESRLLVSSPAAAAEPQVLADNQSEQQQPASYRVDAVVRVAERTKALAELIFEGRAHLRRNELQVYKDFSFEMCYMMAAHRRIDAIFAYEAIENLCYLHEPHLVGYSDHLMNDLFKFTDRGSKDVFRIKHKKKVHLTSGDYINRLITSRNRMKKMTAVNMFDPTLANVARSDLKARVQFEFMAFHVDTVNDELGFDLDDVHWNGDNKFLGFGLDSSSGQNKQVEPKWTADPATKNHYQETMSFELCLTACMADHECLSFSVCVRDGRLNCVLSRVSFDSPKMVVQLMGVLDRNLKIGEKFKVMLDSHEQAMFSGLSPSEEFIEVIKHPGCELHNKIYRDFFSRTSRLLNMRISSVSTPVMHLERCAKLCYQATLSFLRERAGQHHEESVDGDQAPTSDKICDHFYYLDQEDLVAKNPKSAERAAQYFAEESIIGGYCFIVGLKSSHSKPANQDPFKTVKLDLRRYDFDLSSLYAKQTGVYLAQTEMTLDERLARIQIGTKENLARPLAIREHENYGSIQMRSNPQECAKICFDDEAGVAFPVCRSFDFIEFERSTNNKFCSFNSITLKSTLEAQRFDLVKYGDEPPISGNSLPKDQFRVTHYEPREGLVAHSFEEHYKAEMAHEEQEIKTMAMLPRRLHFGGLGLFCVTVTTLITGLVLGVVVGSKLLARLAADAESGEGLVERGDDDEPERPVILFSNLVDSEGHIVDPAQPEGT